MESLASADYNRHLLDSLDSYETYDVYVQDVCGYGNLSDWEGPPII